VRVVLALSALLAAVPTPHAAAASPAWAMQAPDTAAALGALAEYEAACAAEGGALWGASLCGRLVLVHPATRLAVASRRDPEGAFQRRALPAGATGAGAGYVGRLPDGVPLANTSVSWGGEAWAMVLLPLPEDRFARVALLAHESFHRLQEEIGIGGVDALNPHLDERDGRLWLRLELRALAAALRAAEDDVARGHARAALAFRAERHRLYPGADTLEAALEHHEGLAEYTGVRVALQATGVGVERVAQATESFQRRRSFVRSLGYGTAPALGLLLDRFGGEWRPAAAGGAPLAGLLTAALGQPDVAVRAAGGAAAALAVAYGQDEVAAEEDARAAERAARTAAYRAALVEGPVVVLRQDRLMRGFNPNELFPLGDEGTVYPTGTFMAEWGKLTVTAGAALVSPDYGRVAVPAPAGLAGIVAAAGASAARTIQADGWTLELAPGWTVAREGSGWAVVRSAGGEK
jgi:hypothetical protein